MKPWTDAATKVYVETQTALQTVYDALNHGQQQKILKDENVASLFERYGVDIDE